MAQDKRIKAELKALENQYGQIDEMHKPNAERLIQRVAYLKVALDDLEDDLLVNGWTEKFQQSTSVKPYDRRRPNADLYLNLNAQYTKIIRQLDAMLPKSEAVRKDDELLDFLGGGA